MVRPSRTGFHSVCVCFVGEGMGHYRVPPSGNTLFWPAVLTGDV